MRRALGGLRAGCRGGGTVDGWVAVAVLFFAFVDFFPVVVVFLPLVFFTPAFVAAPGVLRAREFPGARGPVVAAAAAARAVTRGAGLAVVRRGAEGWGAEGLSVVSLMSLLGLVRVTPAIERVRAGMFGH